MIKRIHITIFIMSLIACSNQDTIDTTDHDNKIRVGIGQNSSIGTLPAGSLPAGPGCAFEKIIVGADTGSRIDFRVTMNGDYDDFRVVKKQDGKEQFVSIGENNNTYTPHQQLLVEDSFVLEARATKNGINVATCQSVINVSIKPADLSCSISVSSTTLASGQRLSGVLKVKHAAGAVPTLKKNPTLHIQNSSNPIELLSSANPMEFTFNQIQLSGSSSFGLSSISFKPKTGTTGSQSTPTTVVKPSTTGVSTLPRTTSSGPTTVNPSTTGTTGTTGTNATGSIVINTNPTTSSTGGSFSTNPTGSGTGASTGGTGSVPTNVVITGKVELNEGGITFECTKTISVR